MLLALLVPSWLMAQKPIVRPTAKLPVSTLPTRNVQNTQEVIYAVAGEKKSYSRTAEGWTLNSSTGAVSWATKTDETHIVFDGDDVYIKNPFSTFLTLTW